jgi:hypothetical protein
LKQKDPRMKRFLFLVLALGLGLQAWADVNSVDRSKRNFRLDPSTGVVYADLVVAYQDPPSTATLGGLSTTAFLTQAFQNASLELFTASKGAVQLGHVTVIPASFASNGSVKSDPDVVILADPSTTACPGDLYRPEEVLTGNVLVCADAHTGGYLGLAWWLPTTTITGVTDPVFARAVSGVSVSSQGARIAVGWNTLATYGAKVLVHEFGHYLFAMRDEYEGPSFTPSLSQTSLDAFEQATPQNPYSNQGAALSGGSPASASWTFLTDYFGYGMGLLSKYKSTVGYSPKLIDVSVATPFPNPEGETYTAGGDPIYAVTEQISSYATRVSNTTTPMHFRYGGMWSLETAIRTGLNANSATPVNYSPVVLPATSHNTTTEAQVDVYSAGQANIFVFDRSGSMTGIVTGDNGANVTKWDAAVDFFGRLTHPDALGTSQSYPATAQFGFVDFDDQFEQPVTYPGTLAAVKAFTVSYTPPPPPATVAMDKKLGV